MEQEILEHLDNKDVELLVKKKLKLQESAERAVKSTNEYTDHAQLRTECAIRINMFRQEFSHNPPLITCDKLVQEFNVALRRSDNPFCIFPRPSGENMFVIFINFALEHMRNLLELQLRLTIPERTIDGKDVPKIAESLASLAYRADNKNGALMKIKTLVLRHNMLTSTGLDILAKTSACQTSRHIRAVEEELAEMEEDVLLREARRGPVTIALDNMNIREKHFSQDYTQPVFMFNIHDVSAYDMNDKKSFDECMDKICIDTLLMKTDENKQMYDHFLQLAYHEVTKIIMENFVCFDFIKQHFPSHHKHPRSALSSHQTPIHTPPPFFISEQETGNMVKILRSLAKTYLTLLAECVDDKVIYLEMLAAMLNDDTEEEEFEEAERYVMDSSKKVGGLILHGDQLTCNVIESAIQASKGSVSAYERLDFIHGYEVGLFHTEMNVTMRHYNRMMPKLTSVSDKLTMAWFALELQKDYITNEAKKIKVPSMYETSYQFHGEIAEGFLVEAVRSAIYDKCDVKVEDSKESIEALCAHILESKKIRIIYDPERAKDEFYDDVCRHAAEMASQALLRRMQKTAEREGDALAIRALHLVLATVFLADKGLDSNYAPSLFLGYIRYWGNDSRTKAARDNLFCANTTGTEGCCIAMDKLNEHKVRTIGIVFI